MIGRVLKSGKRVHGLLYYLYRDSDKHVNPRIVAGWRDPARVEPPVKANGRRDFRRLADLLEAPLALLGDRAPLQPVWHCTLSVAPGDPDLGDGAMAAIAEEVMHRTGLAERGREDQGVPWVAVRHAASHIHIVAVLARVNGQPARLHNDFYRIGEAMAWAEREYGLTPVARADRTAGHRPSRAETEKARRAGRAEPPRVTLRRSVQAAAAAARTEAEFFAGLQARGVLVRQRASTTRPGVVTGCAVGLPGDHTATGGQVWYGGGKLAADLTLPKLRRRWARGPGRLSGCGMSSPAARAALRREVALCAAASRSEPEFWARLQEAGLLVRRRPDPARPGHPAGHAVTLPGLASRRNRRRTWFAGGTLDKRLTLPAMRARWRAGQPGAAPGPERFAGEDLAEIYRHAAQAARIAARELNSARPQPDIAWAAADLVAAAADATGNPALVQASDGLARACRESWGRIPARSRSGDMLRTTCYLLGACRGNPGWAALIVLITALILLADAIARHREHQQRAAQARAGRDAAAVLTDAAAVLTASTASPAQTPVQVAAKPALRRRPGHLAASRTGPARAPRR